MRAWFHRVSAWFHRVSSSGRYDLLMRLPIIAFTGYFLAKESAALRYFIGIPSYASGIDWKFIVAFAAHVSAIVFLLLLAVFHLVRARPVMKSRGVQPRASALIGLTLANLVFLFPRADPVPLLNLLSSVLILGGNYFCLVTLLALGRSLSIMPEARRAVMDGPYARIRHPLYLAEEIAVFGLFLQFRSIPVALILLAHFGFQILRMKNEERVLADAFPAYADYMKRTARLVPGVY